MVKKKVFNTLLISFLLVLGVFFVMGGSYFSTPSNNSTTISGNYTMTITFDSGFTNVSLVTIYNTTMDGNTALNISNMYVNLTYPNEIPDPSADTISFVVNTSRLNGGGYVDGNYTFTALIGNESESRHVSTQLINFTFAVDNVAPTNITLYAPNGTLVNNATIYFNFSVYHPYYNPYYTRMLCMLWVDGEIKNGTVYQNASSDQIGGSASTNSVSLAATELDAGVHFWNITCGDGANNTNGTGIWMHDVGVTEVSISGANFTLTDTKGPTSTLALSSASIAKGATETLTCTGTDTISTNFIYEIKVTNPAGNIAINGDNPSSYTETASTGSYTTACRTRDASENWGAWTASQTFTVTSSTTSTGGTAGSSSSSSSTPTVTETTEVASGETENLGTLTQSISNNVIMGAESIATFTMATSSNIEVSESHSVTISEITDTSVTIIIQSDPITLELNIGDVKTVDVDGDGTNDLEVTLNGITDGNADLTINTLVQLPEVEPETPEPTLEPETKSSTGWWIVLIIVVIGLIIWFLFKKKKK